MKCASKYRGYTHQFCHLSSSASWNAHRLSRQLSPSIFSISSRSDVKRVRFKISMPLTPSAKIPIAFRISKYFNHPPLIWGCFCSRWSLAHRWTHKRPNEKSLVLMDHKCHSVIKLKGLKCARIRQITRRRWALRRTFLFIALQCGILLPL